MKIGIIGCGSIGKRHAKNLLTLGAFDLIVYEPSSSRHEDLRRELGEAMRGANSELRFTTNISEVWEHDPSLLVIASPTIHHLQQLEEALQNCHADIFVEKPLSHRCEGLERCEELIALKKVLVMTGCNFRFHPSIAKIKSLLEAKAIGEVLWARIEAGQYLADWHPHEDYRQLYSAQKKLGGGCILDYIHEIDYANWLFGTPIEIRGRARKVGPLEIDTENCADIWVDYEGGPLVTIHLDYLQRAYSRSCKLSGTEGTIEWNFDTKRVRCFDARQGRWHEFPEPENYSFNQMYVDEMKYFLNCCASRRTNFSGLAEARQAIMVAERAKASS